MIDFIGIASKLKLDNCKASNVNIMPSALYVPSGGMIGHIYEVKKIEINGCDVADVTINSFYKQSNTGMLSGGIIGYLQYGSLAMNKCNAKNFKAYGGNVAAGIVGFAEGAVNASTCSVLGFELETDIATISKNYGKSPNRAGGIVGFGKTVTLAGCNSYDGKITKADAIGGTVGSVVTTCNISGCEVKNVVVDGRLAIQDSYCVAGGIIGEIISSAGSQIEQCNISNSKVLGKSCSGGVVGFNYGAFITNCNIKNSNVGFFENDGNKSYRSGGITGYSRYNSKDISATNVINTNVCATESSGGIIGFNDGTQSIVNCKVEGSNIGFVNNNADYKSQRSGGVVAFSSGGEQKNISTTQVINTNVCASDESGGIIGFDTGVSIMNCDVKKMNIGFIESDNTYRSQRSGGAVAFAYGSQKISISEVNVENANICAKEASGGIVGNNVNASVVKCNIEGSTIGFVESNSEYKSVKSGGAIGFIGYQRDPIPLTVDTITVKNTDVKGTDWIGGAIGGLGSSGHTLTNLKTENVKIEDIKGNSSYKYLGGIIGITSDSIKNAEANNVTIKCTYDFTGGAIGGIAGQCSSIESGKVAKVEIQSLAASSNPNSTRVEHYTGGIVGITKLAKSCEVREASISNAGDNIYGTGGIIGHGIYGALIQDCNIYDSSITGRNEVGGICGATADRIDNCSVNNTTVKGDNKVGGFVGHVSQASLTIKNSKLDKCKTYGNSNYGIYIGENLAGATDTTTATSKDSTAEKN
ncbi:MAG: hypothetical protein IJ777_02980 [Clostridia bacterium]|nr:hypothetical protein [Clostridia bacterium]